MNGARRCPGIVLAALAASLAAPTPGRAEDPVQWSGFALARAASHAGTPFAGDGASAQLQLGLDWSTSPAFLAHLHLLARSDAGDSRRGHAGSPEAYLEGNLRPAGLRLRLRGGAFFLPTSRENVDALWENPYAISSSALNTWFGEEFRPIGLDVGLQRGGALVAATAFRGNDTFGARPLDPGWEINDRWTLLGEKLRSGDDYSSVSAETDHRLGWAARAGWSGERSSALFTHIDNRSDGHLHGDLYNWLTRFNVAGADFGRGDWTVAGEVGWGTTALFFPRGSFQSNLRASYLLVSRRLAQARVTVRFDAFSNASASHRALTLAGLRTVAGKLRAGLEFSAGAGTTRVLGELRLSFAGH